MRPERALERRLEPVATGAGEHVPELPAVYDGVGDDAAGLRVERVEIVQEPVDDHRVGRARELRGRVCPGEQHQAPAGLPRATVAQRLRLVGEQVERPPGRGDRVDVVPRHRAPLARLDRHAEERAVGDLAQRGRRVLGSGRDERGRLRRGDGDDDVTGADRAGVVLDDDGVTLRAERADLAARARPRAQPVAERRGQRAGAAEEVAGDQRSATAPHEREQPDPAARRELGQLGGRPVRGAREDRLDRRRQRPEELAEGAVILERERPGADVGGGVARPGGRRTPVAGDRALQADAGDGERGPLAQREREPERIGLDPAVREPRGPDGHAHHPAGDRHGLQPARPRERVDQRAGSREQVRAVVHPVGAARVGAQAAAEPVTGLEQQHVALAQPPRRGQSGDPATDHDHVPFLHRPAPCRVLADPR